MATDHSIFRRTLTRFRAMRRAPLRMHSVRAFVVLALLVPAACHRQDDAPAGPAQGGDVPVHVQTTTATERPMPHYLTLTGTLRASEASDLAADATGKVVQTFAERGQPVKRGQLLAVLDSRTAALAATAAEAQSKVAQSQLEQARRDCDRVKHLLETGAISQADYDKQIAQCTAQQWSAAAADAQGKSATKVLGDTSIRAPFDGIIGERYVNVGQYVQPSTRVASIYDPDPLRLELTVPEASVAAIRPDMPVSFTVVAYGDEVFTGHVQFISPNIRESTRDLVVEAVVANGDGRLKPGMFAVAKVLLASPETPVVPSATVVRDDTGTARLYVVVGREVQERLVQVGETVGDVVAIASGIKSGDKVVLKPGADVHDGVRVE
jgi:membrane fusion protein, multidrug efflux system